MNCGVVEMRLRMNSCIVFNDVVPFGSVGYQRGWSRSHDCGGSSYEDGVQSTFQLSSICELQLTEILSQIGMHLEETYAGLSVDEEQERRILFWALLHAESKLVSSRTPKRTLFMPDGILVRSVWTQADSER